MSLTFPPSQHASPSYSCSRSLYVFRWELLSTSTLSWWWLCRTHGPKSKESRCHGALAARWMSGSSSPLMNTLSLLLSFGVIKCYQILYYCCSRFLSNKPFCVFLCASFICPQKYLYKIMKSSPHLHKSAPAFWRWTMLLLVVVLVVGLFVGSFLWGIKEKGSHQITQWHYTTGLVHRWRVYRGRHKTRTTSWSVCLFWKNQRKLSRLNSMKCISPLKSQAEYGQTWPFARDCGSASLPAPWGSLPNWYACLWSPSLDW